MLRLKIIHILWTLDILRPACSSYGCISWDFQRKLTAIYRARTIYAYGIYVMWLVKNDERVTHSTSVLNLHMIFMTCFHMCRIIIVMKSKGCRDFILHVVIYELKSLYMCIDSNSRPVFHRHDRCHIAVLHPMVCYHISFTTTSLSVLS